MMKYGVKENGTMTGQSKQVLIFACPWSMGTVTFLAQYNVVKIQLSAQEEFVTMDAKIQIIAILEVSA